MIKKHQSITDYWIPISVILIFLIVWQVVSMTGLIPGYMLPSPVKVIKAFIGDFPLLMRHARVTLLVAVAPLLILWFSYGIAPKIVLVILASFFPIAVGLLDGFQAVDQDLIRLMHSMKANRWQIFWHVKFPQALGEFFSGLKIAVAYSGVGAVVSEWLGGFYGLGVYMTKVRKSFSYDKMFAVIFLVSAISLVLMALVKILQYQAMPWAHANAQEKTEGKK